MVEFLTIGLNIVSEFMTNVMTVDQWTLFIVAALSAWAGYLLKEALSSSLMAVLFFPGFILGGLISRYLFIHNGIFLSTNKDANVILATGAGIIASLLLLTVLVRVYTHVADIRTRANRRRMDRRAENAKAQQAPVA